MHDWIEINICSWSKRYHSNSIRIFISLHLIIFISVMFSCFCCWFLNHCLPLAGQIAHLSEAQYMDLFPRGAFLNGSRNYLFFFSIAV